MTGIVHRKMNDEEVLAITLWSTWTVHVIANYQASVTILNKNNLNVVCDQLYDDI